MRQRPRHRCDRNSRVKCPRRLDTPMPRSQKLERRDDQREKDRKRRAWEERQNAKGQTRRKGDWDCEVAATWTPSARGAIGKRRGPRRLMSSITSRNACHRPVG